MEYLIGPRTPLHGGEWPPVHSTSTRNPQASFESQACFKVNFEKWLSVLPSELHKQVAILAYEGYTEREIAQQLGVSRSKVNRCRRWLSEHAPSFLGDWGTA